MNKKEKRKKINEKGRIKLESRWYIYAYESNDTSD